jgi:hypothetical protein
MMDERINTSRVPQAPDFLWRLVEQVNFMRLSLEKAAHVTISWSVVAGNLGPLRFLQRVGRHRAQPINLWFLIRASYRFKNPFTQG